MKTKREIKGDKIQFLNWFFETVNLVFNDKLTDLEISLLSDFLSLGEPIYKYDPFSSRSRAKVREIRKEKGIPISPASMNNIISSLKRKNMLYMEDDSILRLRPDIRRVIEGTLREGELTLTYIFKVVDSK